MAYYNDTRKARELSTDLEISHLEYLNKRQKEFDNDIVPEIIDTRTKYEKLKNKEYVDQQLRRMTYNLFDNDIKHSEYFMKMFYIEDINYSKFSTIYDNLVNQFKGTDVLPSFVLQTTKQLIKNIVETGTPGSFNSSNIMENLQQLKEELHEYNFKNKFEEMEAKQKLDALSYLYDNVFNNESNITINTTNKLTLRQYQRIKNDLKSTINVLIETLVSNDIDETTKKQQILEILLEIKTESIKQITTLINDDDISINS